MSGNGDVLKEIVARLASCRPDEVGPGLDLDRPGLRGSLRRSVLIASIRKRLGIECMEAAQARTFGELEAAVERAAGGSAGQPARDGDAALGDPKRPSVDSPSTAGKGKEPAALGDPKRPSVDSPSTAGKGKEPAASRLESTLRRSVLQSVLGCGLDIEPIDSLPDSDDYGADDWYRAHFTADEIGYCVRQPDPRRHFAARWCAKEALKKCDPAFLRDEMRALEVARDPDGRVRLRRHGPTGPRPLPHAVSLTHTDTLAAAVVVAGPAAWLLGLLRKVTRRRLALAAAAAASLAWTGSSALAAGRKPIRLATTTSVEDTGLLPVLLQAFRWRTGLEVRAVATGTGKALKLAENGDADAVLVHDPEAEKAFLARRLGRQRTTVFHNHFVLAGPPDDPAGARSAKTIAQAFSRIAASSSTFVSRGDKSGTHARELSLWAEARIAPAGPWYLESGQGMGQTLMIAGEKRAYTLCDSATIAAFQQKTGLAILLSPKREVRNAYSIILASPRAGDEQVFLDAQTLLNWMRSKEAKSIIRGFKKRGVTLFEPE